MAEAIIAATMPVTHHATPAASAPSSSRFTSRPLSTSAATRSTAPSPPSSTETTSRTFTGAMSLASAAEYAGTGVDYLAVGALTHSVRVLDVGLDM